MALEARARDQRCDFIAPLPVAVSLGGLMLVMVLAKHFGAVSR